MAVFNENTRVKFPALMHLTRIGIVNTFRTMEDVDDFSKVVSLDEI